MLAEKQETIKTLMPAYRKLLSTKSIHPRNHFFYQRWLRLYLEYCQQEQCSPLTQNRLRLFSTKLPHS